jgi:hypothetical protein
MSIAAEISLIVLGAIFKFALASRKIGGLDLHAVGVILMLAGVVGMLLPMLIRNRSRFSRPITRSRQDVADERPRTIVEHFDTNVATDGNPQASGRHRPWAGSGQN